MDNQQGWCSAQKLKANNKLRLKIILALEALRIKKVAN